MKTEIRPQERTISYGAWSPLKSILWYNPKPIQDTHDKKHSANDTGKSNDCPSGIQWEQRQCRIGGHSIPPRRRFTCFDVAGNPALVSLPFLELHLWRYHSLDRILPRQLSMQVFCKPLTVTMLSIYSHIATAVQVTPLEGPPDVKTHLNLPVNLLVWR